MELTSILAGGIEMIDYVHHPATVLSWAMNGEVQTFEFVAYMDPALTAPAIGADVTVESSIPRRLFGGRISSVEPMPIVDDLVGRKFVCQDYTWLLDTVVIESATYASQADSAILSDLVSTYLPEVTVIASTVVASLSITFEDVTLRGAIEAIVERTGADWYIGALKRLRYGPDAVSAAPFGFSDSPDNVTTFQIEQEGFGVTYDFATPANSVTVRGKRGELIDGEMSAPPASADDGFCVGVGASYPPAFNSADTLNYLQVGRDYLAPNYYVYVGLLRFDTSSIPDDATILSATLTLAVQTKLGTTNTPTLGIEYYSGSWPIDSGDYTGTAPASPDALAYRDLITGFPTAGPVDLELTNISNISKTGYTQLRLHVKTPANPTGYNNILFGSANAGTPPMLTVTYQRLTADVVGSYSDATSIATYGTHARTIIERGIETVEEANLRAEYEVTQNANPTTSLSMQWTQDGIFLGHEVPVTLANAGVSGTFVARRIKLTWMTPDETLYAAELGQPRPDLVRMIRRLGSFRQRQGI